MRDRIAWGPLMIMTLVDMVAEHKDLAVAAGTGVLPDNHLVGSWEHSSVEDEGADNRLVVCNVVRQPEVHSTEGYLEGQDANWHQKAGLLHLLPCH